jgi:glycine hydroxymethyltransferase
MQGGPLEHTIAAKATCFRIAMTDAFREYQAEVRRNADALGEVLLDGGLSLVTGGTDTHLLLVDLSQSEWTGKAAEERLGDIGVTVNRNTIPFDERSPFVTSGIRLGSPAMTMRGFDEGDFTEVGQIICAALTDSPDLDGLRARVAVLTAKRPLYEGFRGYTTYVS